MSDTISQYDPVFQAAGQEWNVDPLLLKAMATQESGGNAQATSKAGAQGVMQIIPSTQKELGVTDPTDPVQSIYGGAKYMAQALDAEPTPEAALMYYHGGPDWRDKAGPESKAYVPAVTAHYQQLAQANTQTATDATPAPAQSASSPYDAFLARTGATPSPAAAQPDYNGFLARTGAAVAPPSEFTTVAPHPAPDGSGAMTNLSDADFAKFQAQQQAQANAPKQVVTDPTTGATYTLSQSGQMQAPPGPATRIAQAAIQGGIQGYQDSPSVLNPGAQAWLDKTGLGGATRLMSGALGVGNALTSGAAAGVAQAGEEAGAPIIGRDVAAMVQSPQSLFGTPAPPSMAIRGPQEAAPTPRFVQEYYGEGLPGNPLASQAAQASAAVRPNPLAASVNAPTFVPPGTPTPLLGRLTQLIQADNAVGANRPAFMPPEAAQPPNPLSVTGRVPSGAVPAEAVLPGSVGAAATPALLTNMAPREAAASRATGEMQRLLQPQPLGTDKTIYVPGVEPTAAEIAGDPETSIIQKRTRQSNDTPFTERDTANNEARTDYFDRLAGTPTIVNTLREARSAQAETDLQTAFGDKGKANAQPVVDSIDSILTDPRGAENEAIQKYIAPIRAKLYDDQGNLKTDPESLYGIREEVARQQSKAATAETPTLNHVKGEMQTIKDALDAAIEPAAPGYQNYLNNYAAASKPINTMELLQSYQPTLTNGANRMMTFGKVDKMMRDIVLDRASGGVNAAKSIDDPTMDALFNLHADLRRANNVLLGKPRDSGTSQLMEYGQKLGLTAAHGLAAHVAPVVGNAALHFGTDIFSRASLRRRTNKLLNPETGDVNPLRTAE